MIGKRPPKSENYVPSKLGSRTQGPQGVKKEVRVWRHLKDESSANFLSICGIGFFTNSFAHGSRPALKKSVHFSRFQNSAKKKLRLWECSYFV